MRIMAPLKIILDSWAVLAFLEDEPAAERVEQVFIEAANEGTQLLMTTVNMGEVWYNVARSRSAQEADQAVQRLFSIGINLVPADWELSYSAAQFKSQKRIPYADCFVASLAKIEGGLVLTGDPDFKVLEDQVEIEWL